MTGRQRAAVLIAFSVFVLVVAVAAGLAIRAARLRAAEGEELVRQVYDRHERELDKIVRRYKDGEITGEEADLRVQILARETAGRVASLVRQGKTTWKTVERVRAESGTPTP
jgi:signal transduction histidine kinase